MPTVIIDPGHGGMDPGAVYKGDRKKMIILDWLLPSVNYSLKTVLMFCIHAQMMFMTVLIERQ